MHDCDCCRSGCCGATIEEVSFFICNLKLNMCESVINIQIDNLYENYGLTIRMNHKDCQFV